ncbi:MAG: hypothetical protein WA108_11475 [Thiobacillus sp.]|jgi:hypothetical protein
MQFKDAAATPQPVDIGYGPFFCARRMALLRANPLRGYGRE